MGDAVFIKELESLDTKDPDFLAKMEEISKRVAQSRIDSKKQKDSNYQAPTDPQDELNCEGCQ